MRHSFVSQRQRLKMAFVPLILCLAFTVPASVHALDETQLDYEVKFLLDSDKVLTEDHLLREDLQALISAESDYRMIDAIYLETDERSFNQAGWINRIRWKENKKKIECTYNLNFVKFCTNAKKIYSDISDTWIDMSEYITVIIENHSSNHS